MFRIDLSDLEQKLKQVTGDDLRREIAQAIAEEAVQPELAKYPSPSRKRQPFKSSQSRKYFFAALRSGQITVPYRRTGNAQESQVTATAQGVDVTVPAKYSDLLRTKGKQADYHKGTWDTTEQIAKKIEDDTAELIGTAAVIKQLSKAGLT
jgi:hypothetical protein